MLTKVHAFVKNADDLNPAIIQAAEPNMVYPITATIYGFGYLESKHYH